MELQDWIRAIGRGERGPLARALNLVEDRRGSAQTEAAALLAQLPKERLAEGGHVVGVTGPPGVGKSTLVAALIDSWRGLGRRVGVLAVDPSSPFSGGAVLGDRLRMRRPQADAGVFIRSLAGRGDCGGLTSAVFPMIQLMLAAHDRVLVETVGVGQTEVDVVHHADTVCLVLQPSAGDGIQFIKAGIIEVPAVFIVNKSDLGQVARQSAAELAQVVGPPQSGDRWEPPVLLVSSKTRAGVEDVAASIRGHHEFLMERGRLATRRRGHCLAWGRKRLESEFGHHGISVLGGAAAVEERLAASISESRGVFGGLESARQELIRAWRGAAEPKPQAGG